MTALAVPTAARTWADRLAAVLKHAEHLDLPEATDWSWHNSDDRISIRVLSQVALVQWALALGATVEHGKTLHFAAGEMLDVPVLAWFQDESC